MQLKIMVLAKLIPGISLFGTSEKFLVYIYINILSLSIVLNIEFSLHKHHRKKNI
uniref:Uncharacterized protein n=1 Tax=Rhizophora mucronata TaxID=61149 RepID=A0A2P2NTN0_RHIMU